MSYIELKCEDVILACDMMLDYCSKAKADNLEKEVANIKERLTRKKWYQFWKFKDIPDDVVMSIFNALCIRVDENGLSHIIYNSPLYKANHGLYVIEQNVEKIKDIASINHAGKITLSSDELRYITVALKKVQGLL
jgi:hypothetical protein